MPNRKRKSIQKIQTVTTPGGLTFTVGDYLINKDGEEYRIDRIGREYPKQDIIKIHLEDRDDDGGWIGYGWIAQGDFDNDRYIKLDRSLAEMESESLAQFLKVEDFEEAEAGQVDEQALVVSGTKEHVNNMKTSLEERKRRIAVITRIAMRQLKKFEDIKDALEAQLKTIYRVIDIIELYLGVNEQIVQVCEGNPAPPDTPIALRQQVLYMDEEVGDINWKNGIRGIDFQRVTDFDKWVVEGGGLGAALPELKGVVAFRISRTERQYSGDFWTNIQMNKENDYAYILIRNGEKIYRIWTGTTLLEERLYPAADELNETLANARERGFFEQRDAEEAKYGYQRNLMILQGLIDRTQVFQPVPHEINLVDPDSYGGLLAFVRDGEPALTDGRPTFANWKDEINSTIKRGSRVFICRSLFEGTSKDYGDHFRFYSHNYPPLPPSGIYSVDTFMGQDWNGKPELKLFILYNPGDEVYSSNWWRETPHPRKKRVAFTFEPGNRWVLNYDQLEAGTLDYYASSRLERKHYLRYLPILRELKDHLVKEMAWESHFIELVARRNEVSESFVWEQVTWWKLKNIWKRPVSKDDDLALRMIEKRIKQHRKGRMERNLC